MENWSIKELRAHIEKCGGSHADCLEKSDLIARAKTLTSSTPTAASSPETTEPSLEKVAELIRTKQIKRIIVMAGAGISVSAGIPDFRSPGTGLYDNLQKFNLPDPQSIFTLSYFRENPQPFFTLAKELFPGSFNPTPTHKFIKALADRDLLVRCYTQNIDGLEGIAGVPKELIFQAHGGFEQAHCIECKKSQDMNIVKACCLAGQICRCSCNGLVKPDIVFFGEALPERFQHLVMQDFPSCDCLIVMGTSLQVQPFASLIDIVPRTAMRILINREMSGVRQSFETEIAQVRMYMHLCQDDPEKMAMLQDAMEDLVERSQQNGGFSFGNKENTRDIFVAGDCDAGVQKFAALIGQDWLNDVNSEAKTSVATGETKSNVPPVDLSQATTSQSSSAHSEALPSSADVAFEKAVTISLPSDSSLSSSI